MSRENIFDIRSRRPQDPNTPSDTLRPEGGNTAKASSFDEGALRWALSYLRRRSGMRGKQSTNNMPMATITPIRPGMRDE